MTFIVDGSDWNFNGLSASEAESLIEHALDFITSSQERGEEIFIGDDFQSRPVYETLGLWDIFSDSSPLTLPRELSHELAAWLSKASYYVDIENWPDGWDDTSISIDGAEPVANQDIAWAHHLARGSHPAAVFTLGNSQISQTVSSSGSATLHFVSDEESRICFWRYMIIFDGDSLQSLLQFLPKAYPRLHFANGAIENANRLAGGYLASRHVVQHTLAMLDDHGHWVFTCPPPATAPADEAIPQANTTPSNQLIERRLLGLNLTASPEKPQVRLNRVCREARETVIRGRTLYCEWHVKFQPHQNRLHFHGPIPETSDKVVVAFIHEHLPLPD